MTALPFWSWCWPDVGVTASPADAPAEEDVARRLEPPLSGDDPLAVTGPAARSQVALVDRGLGLLDLEEERIVVGRTDEQREERAEPDAPHADDLEGVVRQGVSVEQDATVLLERLAVGRERRIGHRLRDRP